MDVRLDPSSFALTERPLAQAGTLAAEAVGLRPDARFDRAGLPTGRAIRLGVRPGFDLSVYDLMVETGETVSATTEPCLAVVVLLSGEGKGHVSGASEFSPETPYRAGTLYISLARDRITGTIETTGCEPFRLVELRLSLEFLAQAGVLDVFLEAGTTHDLHWSSGERFWLGLTPAPRGVLIDAEAIFTDALGGVGADLRMEGRALALFETVADLLRAASLASNDTMPPRQAMRLDRVRDAMMRNLAHPWPIAELARLTGLNSRRFKESYRLRFGRPAHADLQMMRVGHGRSLLRGGASVTEASLAVGYTNPSHFAKLFRRMYGVSPRSYR